MSPHKIDVLPSRAALASYGISRNGFLPAEAPLTRLPYDIYQHWESIAQDLPSLLAAGQVRDYVDKLPVLDTRHLATEAEWQRAYSILSILAQSYIWQGPEPSQRLPPPITVPLLQVSRHLEVNPTATYAALNLWNWAPTSPDVNLCHPDGMVALLTQTGTEDESWFFIISNAMEARSGSIIERMLQTIEAVEHNQVATVASNLLHLRESILDIGKLLERMDEHCRPSIFYHHIRPFLAGSMNMEAAGLPRGVFYDEGNGKGEWRRYRGGSNGQSSLLQFFDAVLGVGHERCEGFHAEMRSYMPGPHKRFLDDVEEIANIRAYVDSHEDDGTLVQAYNEAVESLSAFRDKHIALVTRYIIIPSRTSRPTEHTIRRDLATISTKMAQNAAATPDLVGTGGTKLIPFLRTSRDETSRTTILRPVMRG